MSQTSSVVVEKNIKQKYDKYRPLVRRTQVQVEKHNDRNHVSLFKSYVTSHRGEWSKGMFNVIEWTTYYRTKAVRTDGTMDENTPVRVTVEFRT